MADSPPPLPSPEEARAIHAALLAGSRTASSDLAAAYYEHLAAWLWRSQRAAFRGLEEVDCYTAAAEAILSLVKNPAAYQPGRLDLEAYLKMSAKRDLQNLRRSEDRHRRRRVDLEPVEDSPAAEKYLRDDRADPARIVEQREDTARRARQVRVLTSVAADGLSDGERQALELLQQGVRKTEAYARVLGLAELPLPEQRQEVKRVKDKLKKRLQRAGDGP